MIGDFLPYFRSPIRGVRNVPFAHESDDVCLCQDGFLLRQKIHFAMAAACGFGTCVLACQSIWNR